MQTSIYGAPILADTRGSATGLAAENNSSLALRSPLKVAARDDHNATAQGLHQARVAGMPPSHAAQVVMPR
jgi:hypothetical protein